MPKRTKSTPSTQSPARPRRPAGAKRLSLIPNPKSLIPASNASLHIALTATTAATLTHYLPVVHSVLAHYPASTFHLLHTPGLDTAALNAHITTHGGTLIARPYTLPLTPDLRPHHPALLKLAHLTAWPDLPDLVILDADILIRRPTLHTLLKQTPRTAIGGVPDLLLPGLSLINTGVLALHPATLPVTAPRVLRQIAATPTATPAQILATLRLHIYVFGTEHNWQPAALQRFDTAVLLASDPAIIHWSGQKKPWRCESWCGSEQYLDEYRRHLATLNPDPVHLCFSVNNAQWTEYAVTAAWSAATHTPRPIHLHLISTRPDATREWLAAHPRLSRHFAAKVYPLPEDWSSSGNAITYTPATFGKCFAPYLVQEERFVLLDTDIHPRTDLSALQDWDIPASHPFAAMRLKNWAMEPQYRKDNRLENINGGVLSYRRAAAIERVPLEKMLETNRRLVDFTRYPDEDLLLFTHGNDWTVLPDGWNHIHQRFGNHQLVHFICPHLKPWIKANLELIPQYGQFSAFYAEWRLAHESVCQDDRPTFITAAPTLPLLDPSAGCPIYALASLFDGVREYSAHALIPNPGHFRLPLLASRAATITPPSTLSVLAA